MDLYTSSSTADLHEERHPDPIICDFLDHVYDAPTELSAVQNAYLILRRYDKAKGFWKRIQCIFI